VLPTIRTRSDLGKLLTSLKIRGPAAELGVRKGDFTTMLLSKWAGATHYVQVDVWAPLENYVDKANVKQSAQNNYRRQASKHLQDMVGKRGGDLKGTQCRNFTTACARNFPDSYFAFVYVDARHDYLGVMHDLGAWWPKVRPGGVMAGHDYSWTTEPRRGPFGKLTVDPAGSVPRQNWSINFDGTVDPTGRAVKGAVDDFFGGEARRGTPYELRRCPLQVLVTYREMGYNTWMVAKPLLSTSMPRGEQAHTHAV